MKTNLTIGFGRVCVGLAGLPLPLGQESFLPKFLSQDSPDITLEIYEDSRFYPHGEPIYQDNFCRVYDGGRLIENSSHGTMKTWGYSLLHYDEKFPRLQLLSPTHTCTMDQILSGMQIESLLLSRGHAVLHASVIRLNTGAILFTAPSGTGKSTQAALWHQTRQTPILNGDRSLLHMENGLPMVSGLPFAGTSGICEKFDLPISAIVVLTQGTKNEARVLPPTAAIKPLMEQIALHPWNPKDVSSAMELVLHLTQQVPVIHLSCLPDENAVSTLERCIEKERKNP